VVINEIAWMGTVGSANDEWLELYNDGVEDVNLDGWVIVAQDGTPLIDVREKSVSPAPTIASGGFFLLERTDDTSVPQVVADAIYAGAMGNAGEILILKNSDGIEVDRVDGADEWKINGESETAGSNETKETASRQAGGLWVTALASPRAANNTPSPLEEEEAEEETQESPPAVTPTNTTSSSLSVRAHAGDDIVVIVGTEISLDGSASSGASLYRWYLGDGNIKEGLIITHTYNFPGHYLVTLEAQAEGQISIDQANVFVYGGKVLINEVYFPKDKKERSWVEFFNPTSAPINLGGWVLQMGEKIFIIPTYTVVNSNGYLVLGDDITSLHPKDSSSVGLQFPNRVLVDELVIQEAKEGFSAARSGDSFFWTAKPTPSSPNVISSGSAVFGKNVTRSSPVQARKESGDNLVKAFSGVVTQEENNLQNEALTSAVVQKSNDEKSLATVWWILAVVIFSFAAGVFYNYFSPRVKNKTKIKFKEKD